MKEIKKIGMVLGVMVMAFAIAFPVQALITNADIANNAGISYSKLKLSKKITSKDIKDGTIKGDDIDDEAIDTDQLADDAVTAAKIADGTLTAATLADGSVTSAKILNGTIAGADLATNIAITTSGVGTFTGNVSLGDGNDDIVIDATDWGVDADGNAAFEQVTVLGSFATDPDATFAFEGATVDDFETFLYTVDPTADNSITFPNASGTVVLTGSTGTVDSTMILNATITGTDLANDITLAGDLTVTGGEVNFTGMAAAPGTPSAGKVYYNSTDGNLYVYDGLGGAWRDMTAAAAGAQTLDEGYNASAGASTIIVDNGDLTFRSNAAATGDIIVNLDSTGDFILQNNGADVVTFDDSGNLTMASGTLALNGDTVTSDGALAITGATGLTNTATTGDASLIASAASVVIRGVEAAADTILLDANDNAAGGIDADAGTGGIAMDTTGSVSIDAAGASNLTTSVGDLSLISSAGSIVMTGAEAAADAIDIDASNAAGGIDIDAGTGTINMLQTGTVAGNGVVVATTDAGISLSAVGAANGDMTLAAGDDLDVNVTSDATLDAVGVSIDGTAASNFTVTGAADLTLSSTLGSIVMSGGEAAANAIDIDASNAAGGIDIDAGTGTIDILQTGTIAGNGVIVATTDAGISLSAVGAANGDMTLTVGDAYVANVTGIWDNNVTGAATIDAAGVSIDGTAASNFTTSAGDLTLESSAASVVMTGAENAADAIDINATAGGIDIDATGEAGQDINILNTGGSVYVGATESAADSVKLESTLGGIDIFASGASAGEDIDITATGSSVNISSTENVADAIVLSASAGGMQLSVAAGADAEDMAISTTGTEGDVVITTADDFSVVTAASAVVDIADDAVAKTIHIGGVTNSGTDTVSIATEATAADVIAIGNANAATTLALTGGTAWSITTAGTITTAEDLFVNGDEIDADGTLDITGATGMNINTGAGDITLDPTGNDVLPGGDSADNLGEDATRWATIFADTLNYATAITDDNAGATTVTLGDDSAADAVTITANTTITDAQWSIGAAGAAAFASMTSAAAEVNGAITLANDETISNGVDGQFLLHRSDAGTITITTTDNDANADLLITSGGTGGITLGDADSNVTVASGLTVTTGGATVTAGGVTITAGGLDMTGDNITNVGTIGDSNDAITIGADGTSTVAIDSDNWDMTSAGAVSGLTGVVSTGTVDFSGATAVIIPSGAGAPAAGGCDAAGEVGSLYIDTASAQGSIYVCRASGDWEHVDMVD
jgi:hypothetical protein